MRQSLDEFERAFHEETYVDRARRESLRRRAVMRSRQRRLEKVNKRAGGMGLISGRKAFQRPMDEGVALLHAIQDVYLSPEVTVA